MQKGYTLNKSLVFKEFSLNKFFFSQFALVIIYSLIQLVFNSNIQAKEHQTIYQCSNQSSINKVSDRFIGSDVPFQTSKKSQGVDAEVEPTEDDIHHESLASNESFHPIITDDFFYTSYIKSRFLGLTSKIHSQTEVPYFVLYHSWKNFIV